MNKEAVNMIYDLEKNIILPEGCTTAPRKAQIDVLKQVSKALREGYKFIIIQAPTGVGKSVIGYTILNAFGEGYICTSTKALQTQYLEDFPELVDVKGRSNFTCLQNGKTCDLGECKRGIDFKCDLKPLSEEMLNSSYGSYRAHAYSIFSWVVEEEEDRCPYWSQKVDAINSNMVIHNYIYLIGESHFSGGFGKRKALISDEGHNIESSVSAFVTTSLSNMELNEIFHTGGDRNKNFFDDTSKICDDSDELVDHYIEWGKSLYDRFLKEKENLKEKIAQTKYLLGDAIQKKNVELAITYRVDLAGFEDRYNLMSTSDIIKVGWISNVMEKDKDNWAIQEFRNKADKVYKVKFLPIKVSKYTRDYYFNLGEYNIILSATIGDCEQFTKDLGIKPGEYKFIEVPPAFPVNNHKIINLSIADFKWNHGSDPFLNESFCKQVVERIDMILELMPTKKGIIHCNTYGIRDTILRFSKYPDRLVSHNREDREDKLREHIERTDGAVLLSPSMTEGVDLAGTLSEFQILIKYPLPSISDPAAKKRSKQDPKYYNYKATITTVQAIGRSVRNEKDKVITFTLDTRFSKIKENAFTRHVVKGDSVLRFFIGLQQGNKADMKTLPDEAIIKNLPESDFYDKLTAVIK